MPGLKPKDGNENHEGQLCGGQSQRDEGQAQKVGRRRVLAIGANEEKVGQRRERDARNGQQHGAEANERTTA